MKSHKKARRPGRISKKNPPVKIYEKLVEIVAVKGPGHPCDAACKRARHTYVHKFTSRPSIYGMPDGSLVIR
jgi:hypothetical protein